MMTSFIFESGNEVHLEETTAVADAGSSSSADAAPPVPGMLEIDLTGTITMDDLSQEILQKILEDVISSGFPPKVSLSKVKICRAVSKSWLRTTGKILWKKKTPLFHLSLNHANSVTGTEYVQDNGKLLATFNGRVSDNSFLEEKIPFFTLSASEDFFRRENRADFLQFLTLCARELLEMNVSFPQDGGSMPYIFPPLNLPSLRKIVFSFSKHDGTITDGAESRESAGSASGGVHLLQNLINGCLVLRSLEVHHDYDVVHFSIPLNDLVLPQTLTHLLFHCWMDKYLEMLATVFLPRLAGLVFKVGEGRSDLISQILRNFRTSLKHVYIQGPLHDGQIAPPLLVRFPVMETLVSFKSNHVFLELERMDQLEQYLPTLNKLQLFVQRETAFHRWVGSSQFSTVTTLAVTLANEKVPQDQESFVSTFPPRVMLQVAGAFPNLTELHLAIGGADVSTVRHIFASYRPLQKLRLDVVKSGSVIGPATYDSLLLGIPRELAVALASVQKYRDAVDLHRDKFDAPSICHLSDLHSLALSSRSNRGTPMISDVVFHYGFLKMPNLQKLELTNRFEASSAMVGKWLAEGRIINTPTH